MKIKNVGVEIGSVLDVRPDFGEHLLKVLGGKFVAVSDDAPAVVEVMPEIVPAPGSEFVLSDVSQPRKGKRR